MQARQNTAEDETGKGGYPALLPFEETIAQHQKSAHILSYVSVSNTSTKTFTLVNALTRTDSCHFAVHTKQQRL